MSENSVEPERRYYQPTYQTLLIRGLMDVIERMNQGDTGGTWECLKTLYRILPPEVEKEVQPEYDRMQADLDSIQERTKTFDLTLSVGRSSYYSLRYLYGSNRRLLGIFKNSLHKHGYLEEFTIRALNPKPKHIGSEE